MDSSASIETHHDPHSHAAEHEHHELGWWRKYIFSTDHKVIGIQYGLCGLAFLFLGFCLMMLMRWQLAYPGQALPVIGKFLPHIFGAGSMPDGKMTPDFYNSLGAMHGTIMIFLGVVPLAFAAFGNFVVPLQIGAPDMTFPKVNAAIFWVGAVCHCISVTAGVPAARSCDCHAINGSRCAYQLFPPKRSGGEWRAGVHQRWWQPAFVATSVLVPRTPRSLRFDFACIRHCGRNSGEQFTQAALGI